MYLANMNKFKMIVLGKPSEFHTAEVSILQRRWAHNSTCISGFQGTGDVDVDAGAGTMDDDPVVMHLGYHGV